MSGDRSRSKAKIKAEPISKSEARNPKQIQMFKKLMAKTGLTTICGDFFEFRPFRHSGLFRISDFVLRI